MNGECVQSGGPAGHERWAEDCPPCHRESSHHFAGRARHSVRAVGKWCDWQALQEAYAEANQATHALLARLPGRLSKLSEEQTTELGMRHFNFRALRSNNNREWANTQRLRIADAHLALVRRRLELLEKQSEKPQPPPVEALSLEEQERRMKAIFGIVS